MTPEGSSEIDRATDSLSGSPPTSDLPDQWGIHGSYTDAAGVRRQVQPETVALLRRVIGKPPADLESRAPIVSRPGRDLGLGRVEVRCEDGQTRVVDGRLPVDFPLGYHELTDAGRSRRVIVSPGRCWLPAGHRTWGWTVQLYAARSRGSWGIGDLESLRLLREWSERLGAGFLMVNPLHASAPTSTQDASPYLPTTRRFRNPLYLSVDNVEGADRLPASYASRARYLNAEALIERGEIWTLKRSAMEELFSGRGADAGFGIWREEQGAPLEDFAVWCALAEVYGASFREWPVELQFPDSAAVGQFVDEHPDRVSFHAWLQWVLEQQLRVARGQLPVLQDLPIGVDGTGADAWLWQEELAEGVSIGAPPDAFSATGQDWGSPPFIPWRLRAANYEPFIASIRATMADAGGLRIDHVMGLFRLWWVPPGEQPSAGAYVRYPAEDLLDIVALESCRARALVVGEDLGTVEPGVRESLADHQILSYRLLWFEADDPAQWPAASMAAVTTHDLPTVAGLWSGADLEDQHRYTATPLDELRSQRDGLLAQLSRANSPDAGLGETSTDVEAVGAAYELLARAPSVLLSATLDDALAVTARPNLPGTVARPNWSLPLPLHVEDMAGTALAERVAARLDAAVLPQAHGADS